MHLKSLQAIASFGLTSYHIEHLIDQFGALRIVPLCPIIASTTLTYVNMMAYCQLIS